MSCYGARQTIQKAKKVLHCSGLHVDINNQVVTTGQSQVHVIFIMSNDSPTIEIYNTLVNKLS